jgi:hypothetical protein
MKESPSQQGCFIAQEVPALFWYRKYLGTVELVPGGRTSLFLSQAEEQRSQKTRALLKSRALVLKN